MKTAIAALLAASLVTAHAADLPATAADHPWVLLIPAGKFSGRDGRGPYDAGDKVKLEQIAEMTRRYAGNTDILVDYEHQSIHALTNGQPAPAAGWIKEVQARDDGLYGRVEWTANAAAAIKGREYRYLSPVYFHTKDGDVLALQTVALTNVPNLDMIEVSAHSVFNFQPHQTEVPMKRVLAALGLADGTSEDDVLTAVNSLLTSSTAIAAAAGLTKDAKSDQVMTAVQSAFADRKKIAIAAGQPENASVDAIVGAFASAHTAGAADPTKFVPIAAFNEMRDKVDNAYVSGQYSNRFPVNVGEPLAVNLKVRGYAAARGQFRAEINWSDKDDADLGSDVVNGQAVFFSGSSNTTAISAIMNPPSGAVTARLRMRVACDASGNFVPAILIRSISVRRAASAELIVDGSITADKITTNAITADKINANAITSDKINANAITAGKIAADSITSAAIQAGAVKAEQIAAGAITAGKLTIMDQSNLVAGELLDPVAWNGGMNGDWSLSSSTATQDDLGRVMMYYGASRTARPNSEFVSDQYSNRFPINVGEQIAVSLKVRGYSAARGQFRCEIQFLTKDFDNVDSQNVGNQNVAFTGSTASTTLTQIFSPPATAAYARLRMRVACDTSGNFVPNIVIRNISVRRAASSELIVDGAITSDKVTANAISADKIQANAITSDKITTNAITAGKVAAGAIDTDKLAANAITADKIDTNAVTAQKVAAGAITAVKIGAGAITTDKLDANAVTAAKIAAGTIGADQIAANAITARNLLLTDFSNMVPDNALQDAKSWSLNGGSTAPYFSTVTDIGPIIRFNDNRAASSGSTYIADATSQSFNVRPGDELRFGATIDFNSDAANQGVRIYLNFYDANGNNVGSPSYNEASAANLSPRNVAQNATVPAGAVTAQLYIRRQVPTAGATSAGTLYVWNPFCYRRANAELIVDGSITADKITLNSLTAINLKVTNADITDLTLNGEKLVNGAISAVYYNTSSSFIPKSATTTILSRSITLADDERLIISADWNLRGLMSVVNTEIFYAGSVQLKVGSTVLDTIKIQGPAIDTYACSSQSISGSYTKSGSGSVTVTLVFIVGSGGAMRNNDMNMGYFGTGTGFTNDGVSWTITRLKK